MARELSYKSLGYLLDDVKSPDEYDYVDICVPTHHHYQLCKHWLNKTNVLVEKPFCLESAHAEELIQLAEKNGRKLGVCHNQLYYPLLENLSLVTVDRIVVNRTYNEAFPEWVDEEGGGALYEVGYHALYTMLHWMKQKPKLQSFNLLNSVLPKPLKEEVETDYQDLKVLEDWKKQLLFVCGEINIFKGKKSDDSIQVFQGEKNLSLYPWYNSKYRSLKLRQLAIASYYGLHRELPHTSTYRRMLEDWQFHLKNQIFLDSSRLSPMLSLDCVRILESCEKWSDA